jgi:hypothetical protein
MPGAFLGSSDGGGRVEMSLYHWVPRSRVLSGGLILVVFSALIFDVGATLMLGI